MMMLILKWYCLITLILAEKRMGNDTPTPTSMCMYMHVFVCECACIYLYIYTQRVREIVVSYYCSSTVGK